MKWSAPPQRRAAATTLVTAALVLPCGIASAICQSAVNPDATDPALRSMVVGTWYSETRAAQLGMTQRMYQTFLPTGVFDYRDQTCSGGPGSPCSQNAGHGVWNARRQADGSIYIRIQFNDLRRTNECTGWAATFPDRNTMLNANGGSARRTQ